MQGGWSFRSSQPILGNEGKDMKKSKALVKWDRKQKRFISDSGKCTTKKIKTENGALLLATHQMGLYKEWKSQQRY